LKAPELNLTGELPERLTRTRAAPRFFQIWGVAPACGRDFTPAEDRFGGPPAAVINDRLWRPRFAADLQVIGPPSNRISEPFPGSYI